MVFADVKLVVFFILSQIKLRVGGWDVILCLLLVIPCEIFAQSLHNFTVYTFQLVSTIVE